MPTHPPPTADRQLRVMFLITSMPVGGAETLLMNLVRGMDRTRFLPEICCLKQPGPLGETLQAEMPIHSRLIRHKYDIRVLFRLQKLFRQRQVDAVVTVGAGDKMFWGRLAARLARVPVVLSALHSTGWPDGVGRLNRLLTPWTDAFIGVADTHTRFLVEQEKFPCEKVHTIHNGVDTCRFAPSDPNPMRSALGISLAAPVVGIVAALRTEKNHELFLRGAQQIARGMPGTQFLIIGDGPRREFLERLARELDLAGKVHFLGARDDIPQLLSACNLLTLTSHNEANPVSILEAFASGCPVVAADVGSIRETVFPGETGCLFPAGDTEAYVEAVVRLLKDPALCRQLGNEGRRRVRRDWSLRGMVEGYQTLIARLHEAKDRQRTSPDCYGSPMVRTSSQRWRRLGPWGIAQKAIYRGLQCLMTLDMTRVVLLRRSAVRLPHSVDPRYHFRQLTAAEVRTLRENPQNGLAGARVDCLEEGRHFCFAALCEGQLVSYVWSSLDSIDADSHRGRQKNTGVAVSCPSHMAFMYHGFTHPEHRGQGLYGWVNGLAFKALAKYGIDTALSTMDWTNHAAWQSCRRLGYADLGLLGRWGWANWMHTNAPRQARELGIQFGPQALTSRGVPGGGRPFLPAEPVA